MGVAVSRTLTERVQRNGVFVTVSDDELRASLNELLDVSVLPYTCLSQRFIRGMGKDVLARPHVDTKAFDEERGVFYDIAHLVGAAYCDVFTCDQLTQQRLANGRALIGKPRPITAVRGVGALNRRLLRQLAAWGCHRPANALVGPDRTEPR